MSSSHPGFLIIIVLVAGLIGWDVGYRVAARSTRDPVEVLLCQDALNRRVQAEISLSRVYSNGSLIQPVQDRAQAFRTSAQDDVNKLCQRR